MRGALVIALCATGCFSDRGVALEVDVGGTGATLVELFIGNQVCDRSNPPKGISCDGIQPKGGTSLLSGEMWFRDPASDGMLQVKGRTATLQLKSDQPATLPIVIAVGFDQNMKAVGTATLTDLEVPSNSARVVTTTLVMANTPGSADLVKVWDSPPTSMTSTTSTSSCVAVQHGASTPWDFVVPFDDPDCDGLTGKAECNANAYLGSNVGGHASAPNCFGDGSVGTCLLGSLSCMDVGSIPGMCAPQSSQHDQPAVCVPSQFCTALPPCTDLTPGCPLGQLAQVPRITCQVLTNTEGAPCTTQPSTTISLDWFYAPTDKCDQPLLGGFQFTSLPTDPIYMFGNVVMGFGSPRAPCDVTITWKSGTRMATDPTDAVGVMQLQTGVRLTLLPITFHFVPGTCSGTGQFTCSPAGNTSSLDPLSICAHQQ